VIYTTGTPQRSLCAHFSPKAGAGDHQPSLFHRGAFGEDGMEQQPLIEFRDVVKRFGERTILNGVDFRIYEDETTTIIGLSETGKSVTLKLWVYASLCEACVP
jgi:ABC-type glutathione transport system ATPase component